MKNKQQESKLNELKDRMNWSDDDLTKFIYEMRKILTQFPNEGNLEEEGKEIIISRFLKDIGCPASILGYKYLKCALFYLLEQPKDRMERIKIVSEVYSMIAKSYNTTYRRVERNIRTAIENIFNNYNPLIDTVFGYSTSYQKGKLTNKEFIWGIVDYLQTYENL